MNEAVEQIRRGGSRILRVYLIAVLLVTAVIVLYYWIAYRQPLSPELAGTAADPHTFMSEAEQRQTAAYSIIRDSLFFVGYFWEWGILLWLLTSERAGALLNRLKAPRGGRVLRFIAYIAGIAAALFAFALPLRLFSYAVSRWYGISTLSLPGWLRDQLVYFLIDLGTMLAVGAAVIMLLRRGGAWWFKLWLLSIPFLLFMMLIRPILLDPLFYRYEPLSDSALQRSIVEMTAKAGIPTERIYEANYSEKTNAINAYVDGIGPSLRIVIWDTALKKLTEREILVMTAHEMAHYVKHHLQWSAFGAIASMFVMLWLGHRALKLVLRRWSSGLSISHGADWAVLPLLLLIFSVLSFVATPVSSAVSRQAELAADRYAYELTGDAEAAVSLYQKLALSSKGAIHPPALTYWFRYTHPSLGGRIIEAMKYER